jgi:hypothetical protein
MVIGNDLGVFFGMLGIGHGLAPGRIDCNNG